MSGLKSYDVVLKDLPAAALLCPDVHEIWINHRLPFVEQVISLIHELLHLHHRDLDRFISIPERREAEVESEARALYERLTPREHGLLECFLTPQQRRRRRA